MKTLIKDLMSPNVKACHAGDSLAVAAELMWDADCGSVPVLDDEGRATAMITDRDICMAALLRGLPLSQLRVADAMSRRLVACRPEDEPRRAEELMAREQVRRLPVLDSDGRLVGLLSLSDLARCAERQVGTRTPDVTEVEVARTLAATSTPRRMSAVAGA